MKSHVERWRSGLVLATVGLAAAGTGTTAASPLEAAGSARPMAAPQESGIYESRTSEGEVTLEVRPSWREGALVFEVAANTHSVDLARLELSRLLRLTVGGETLAPEDAGRLQGHHARTTARFTLDSPPEGFTLVIREVPDVPVRRLSWGGDETRSVPPESASPLLVVGGIAPGGLAVIDPAGLGIRRLVEGLEAVHGAALSLDGKTAFALNMADADRAVTVVETATGRVRGVLGLPGPSHHAAADPAADRLYVAYGRMGLEAEAPRGVAAVVPSTGAVRVRPTEGTPFYLATDPAGERLYATVQGTNRLLALSLPGLEVVGSTGLSGTPSHLDVSADGTSLYVALVEGRVAKVDARAMEVLAEEETATDAHAVALAGEPRRLFVANRGAGTVTVHDPVTLRREAELDAVTLPVHLLASPSGTLLISAGGARELVEVDPATLRVVGRVALPFQPHQSAGAP